MTVLARPVCLTAAAAVLCGAIAFDAAGQRDAAPATAPQHVTAEMSADQVGTLMRSRNFELGDFSFEMRRTVAVLDYEEPQDVSEPDVLGRQFYHERPAQSRVYRGVLREDGSFRVSSGPLLSHDAQGRSIQPPKHWWCDGETLITKDDRSPTWHTSVVWVQPWNPKQAYITAGFVQELGQWQRRGMPTPNAMATAHAEFDWIPAEDRRGFRPVLPLGDNQPRLRFAGSNDPRLALATAPLGDRRVRYEYYLAQDWNHGIPNEVVAVFADSDTHINSYINADVRPISTGQLMPHMQTEYTTRWNQKGHTNGIVSRAKTLEFMRIAPGEELGLQLTSDTVLLEAGRVRMNLLDANGQGRGQGSWLLEVPPGGLRIPWAEVEAYFREHGEQETW